MRVNKSNDPQVPLHDRFLSFTFNHGDVEELVHEIASIEQHLQTYPLLNEMLEEGRKYLRRFQDDD